MSMKHIEEQALEQLTSQARRFYDEQLKDRLEPAHNGELVAIDPAAGLHAVGMDPLQLHDELIAQGSTGLQVLLRVGHVWTIDILALS
jgi:hypothetical protein